MKVALICMYYDYGIPDRGVSYEYNTYYQPLINMGHEVVFFDFASCMNENGKDAMNRMLVERIKEESPEVAFFALYKDEFYPETLEELKKYTKTFCFFQDDTWRIDYTLYWGRYFHLFGTPDPRGLERYQKMGIKNAIHVPFGANEYLFKKSDTPKEYDVSFVGVKHPYREWIIKRLEKEGIKVYAFGRKWKNGKLNIEEMIDVFNKTKINLNISNSISYDIRYLFSSPRAVHDFIKNNKRIEQQKARPFEVCGSGGFLLTYYVSGLEDYYHIGKDIAIYTSPDELLEQIKYYLEHDKEREEIALSGYEKTRNEHTFTKRFETVFLSIQGA